MLPTIRSYLKLYTTLPLSKLATFMAQNNRNDGQWDLDKETQSLSIHLLCFKHKMKNVVWLKGASGLEGKFQSGSEVRNPVFVILIVYNMTFFRYISVGFLHRQ